MQGTVSKINGVSLWYTMQGQGIPFVLIHGGPGSYDYLEPLAELMDNHSYKVIRYEQRGSSRSEKKGPYNIETFIEDLEQLRIHLDFESWVVCGHSWGASLALAYVAKYHNHVNALIYISGTGINSSWHAEYRINRLNKMSANDREEYSYLRSIVETLNGEDKKLAKERLRELGLRTDLFNQDNYDMLPRVDGQFVNNEVNQKVGSECKEYFETEKFEKLLTIITAPSLFIHGEVDPRPYHYANELSNNLQNSEFILIPKTGHYPWLDSPSVLVKHIDEFIGERVLKTS
ncbi:alpha/beta fold hydrolase [Paenibacillus cymbidii]|uniref:alpha/beta fold hydrolase n=1 Tax=Paenibacillus cymbidii TaxID=1639034 RepID=UPI0010812A5E|nr:alpha/beta hydrolase [Paenibacillus cymbidii]